MEKKIYEILKKHKLLLKKREELMVDLLELLDTSTNNLEDDRDDYCCDKPDLRANYTYYICMNCFTQHSKKRF